MFYRHREKKRKICGKNNKSFFPQVSCFWLCTALKICINHFYTWNCLRKLEILVQRNQFTERMSTCCCFMSYYTYKRITQRTRFTDTAVLYINTWLTPISEPALHLELQIIL
ncbi:hypothetical protein KIL84_001502 [Mauremys mutica]|uniref:Uncharacterized protein n=1 Tax=Mauremys mutica TaxID=74926 RepID=A0A9D4APA1_9SAUR|nr:hypothetical protein KIL84_001502 [Mauremys mutica]